MTWSRSWYTFHPPWNLQIFSPNLHIVLYSYQQYINVPICPHPHQHVIFTSFSSVQFSLVTQSCLTLCDPINCSTPGLLVCWEPAPEIPPMAKVIRKSPDGQRRVRTQGTPRLHPWQGHAGEADQDSRYPLDLLDHLPPKPKSVCYTTLFWH